MNSEAEDNIESNSSGRNSALSLPFAALDFVTRLATGIFSRGRKNIDSDNSDDKGENELQSPKMQYASGEKSPSDESSSQKSDVIKNTGGQINHEDGERDITVEDFVSSNTENVLCNSRDKESEMPSGLKDDIWSFKRFDITKDPSDHHYLGSNGQVQIALFL